MDKEMVEKKKVLKIVEKLIDANDQRIADYKKNGGREHLYLDGKDVAYIEVRDLIRAL